MDRMRPWKQRAAGILGGVALTFLVGVLGCVVFPLGLARLSYDLPFLLRPDLDAPDVVLVFLNETSRRELEQPPDRPWDRSLHVRLLERLTREQAALVFYDIVFEQSQPADAQFGEAIKQHGKVVLVAMAQNERQQTGHAASSQVRSEILPNAVLRDAAAAYGLATVELDEEFGVRKIFPGTETPSAAWVAAAAAGAPVTRDEAARFRERWLNFHGPSPAFDLVSFHGALAEDGTPPGFFRGKAVFIGGQARRADEREAFATPYTRAGLPYAPGVELLATAYSNLVRGRWLERLSDFIQLGLVLGWAMLLGGGLVLLRPWHATWVSVVAAAGLSAASCYGQWHLHRWWSWLVPVVVQTPAALGWAIGYQYFTVHRQRQRLRRAFSAYLSPHLAERIADRGFDLTPGGHVVDATILFTDLEGFTAMAESLDPAEVSRILIEYFERTTRHILQEEGTIIKYVGDSVIAVWGAPLPDAHQAERAVRAACGLIEAARRPIAGRTLRTRIGINSGPALAGNLGSRFRFDYAVIGSTTNIASRLEALNKTFGTEILIGAKTREQLGSATPVRYLGQFLLRGVTQPQAVYEVPNGVCQLKGEPPAWLDGFERAVTACASAQWDEAERLFQSVLEARGADGPSSFYLKQLRVWRAQPLRSGGVIDVSS